MQLEAAEWVTENGALGEPLQSTASDMGLAYVLENPSLTITLEDLH